MKIETGGLRCFSCVCRVSLVDVLGRVFAFLMVLLVLCDLGSVGFAATPPRMRPYTGVGLFVFAQPDKYFTKDLQFQLYEEPGLSRVGVLDNSILSGNEWIFGFPDGTSPLIVSARKGDWLRVVYDDAGREAWVNPEHKGRFQSWEQFLKRQTCYLLPGLQLQYYKLFENPGGKVLDTLSSKQVFRVLTLENEDSLI